MLPLDLPISWSGGKKSKKEPIKIVRCKNLRIKKKIKVVIIFLFCLPSYAELTLHSA